MTIDLWLVPTPDGILAVCVVAFILATALMSGRLFGLAIAGWVLR